MKKNGLDEKLRREEKQKRVRDWLEGALKNWSEHSPKERHEIQARSPGKLACLPDQEYQNCANAILRGCPVTRTESFLSPLPDPERNLK